MRQALDIRQNQIGSLVGGEAPGKTDSEGVGAEDAAQLLQRLRRFSAPRCLFDGLAADKFQQPRLKVEVGLPQLAVVDVFNSLPDAGLAAMQRPIRPEMAIEQAMHLRG